MTEYIVSYQEVVSSLTKNITRCSGYGKYDLPLMTHLLFQTNQHHLITILPENGNEICMKCDTQ